MKKINHELRKKILEKIPELRKCYQCGTCVSACFAEKYIGSYNPRKKILGALYGDINVLNDELWKCGTCNACNSRCPQEVNPYEALVKLKNLAIKENLCCDAFKTRADLVLSTGNALPVNDLVKRQRQELGLPELKDIEEVKKLI